MASSNWSNLPPELLLVISKIHSTDVDILRIRSVCSSWRSAVPPRLRPSAFPLKLPPLLENDSHSLINYTTIYRLSPPEHGPGAGDSSDGWLFRALEVSANRFAVHSPLVPIWAKPAPGSIPESLNLLHYRITEICKCYFLYFVGKYREEVSDVLDPKVEKVVVLSNDCDFVVFALFINGHASCWKYGEKDWTSLNTMGQRITDIVVSNGKCYAISSQGVLFYYDSGLKPTKVDVANLPPISLGSLYCLLECKSDWYVLLKTIPAALMDYEDASGLIGIPYDIPFKSKVYKKCNNNWERVRCLPDEMVISCEDASIVLPVKDFRSCKGNCVHLAMKSNIGLSDSKDRVNYHGVYDLPEAKSKSMKPVEGSQFMAWPPPSWLLSG